MENEILPLKEDIRIKDANNRSLQLLGTINLHCQVGTRAITIPFYVVERLATDVILGCDFCDKHIVAIRPRQRKVDLDDGTSLPIIRRPETRRFGDVPLPEAQRYVPAKGRAKRDITVAEPVTVQPDQQSWVTVETDVRGLILVEPLPRVFNDHLCLAATGIAQVEPRKRFRILVANVGKQPHTFDAGQRIAKAEPHPSTIFESNISHAELFGLTEETSRPQAITNKYRKRDLHAKDESLINKHLSDLRESHMEDDDEPTRARDIPLPDLPRQYEPRVREMLRRHEDMWLGKLGNITVTEHAFDLVPGARPFKSPPFRAGPKTRELVQFEVNKQLKAGVIEPVQSEWAAPVLFDPKKDGKLRFCVDYRKLNTLTVRDSYPLPRMDECIDSLGEATVFTTLDAYAGYWQLPIKKEDRHKTAFVCHTGTYQYNRMPFGLTNAPASFQRALDMILTKYKWKQCLIYLDDVIVFSNSIEDHIQHVDDILSCLAHAGVTLKIKKCSFFTTTVEYLGHIIKPGRLEIDRANTESLRQAQPPADKSSLRSFLGLCNVYRRFIKDFSTTAGPLNALLRKNSPDQFVLNEEQTASFRSLIDSILSPDTLALPKPNLQYSVDTDASSYGLGCTLFQTQEDGERRPIGFWSRSLNEHERNYSTTERECLAVIWALKTLRPYLMFEKFTVHTDHGSLRWLFNITEPSGRLMRWRLLLSEFDFEIKYKKGNLNCQADALSRLRTLAETIPEDHDTIPSFLATESEESETDLTTDRLPANLLFKQTTKTLSNEHFTCPETSDLLYLDDVEVDAVLATLPVPTRNDPIFTPISHEELVIAQQQDSFCSDIRRKLNEGEVLPFGFNQDGLLCRTVEHEQVVIPHALKARVLHIHHYARLAGHPGGRKLYAAIRRNMYWPAMAVDCYATVRRCPTCAKNRIKLRKNTTTLQLFPANGPLEAIAIDIMGELIKTSRGNQYLLVITDRFTKLTKTVPLRGVSSAEIARAFVNEWIFNYGPPLDVLADNAKYFSSRFFLDVCRILNIHNSFTTTYHPQANGQVERFNRSIKDAIRAYLDDHPRDWDLYTSALTFAYNCQPHSSTAVAPFELVLSRPPPPLALRQQPSITQSPQESRQKWKHWLERALHEGRERLKKTQERYKRNYDARLRKQRETIKANDTVYLRKERRDESEHRHKLATLAEGPFKVKSATRQTVVIERTDGTLERVSRDRVTIAPDIRDGATIQETIRPMTDDEIVPKEFPTGESENLRDIPRGTVVRQSDRTSKDETWKPSPAEEAPSPTGAHSQPLEEPTGVEDQEYVMERIISHRKNTDPNHSTAKVGEMTYRVRWYGFPPEEDTYEPIRNLPHNKVVSYYKRKKLPLPGDIDQAMDG